MWSASTHHLHREPCSEQQAQFLACPTLPPHSWSLGNPLLSMGIKLPIMLCGRRRRCTSTGSPAQSNRPSFWSALPFPALLGPREPAIVNRNQVAHHAVKSGSRGSPAQNNRPSFWPALPSPPQLVPREPPIVDGNQVAHHAVRSSSTLHLRREPCSEQQAQFLACPSLPCTVGP